MQTGLRTEQIDAARLYVLCPVLVAKDLTGGAEHHSATHPQQGAQADQTEGGIPGGWKNVSDRRIEARDLALG
jgi:hypothetical protein